MQNTLTRGDKQEESNIHVCDPKHGLYPQVVQKCRCVFVVGSFAPASALFGYLSAMIDALVLSLTPFHGRAFFPGLGSEATLYNPLVVLVAEEAVIGHFIEISYVGKFAQR